jgi:hypothetical protein
VRICSLLLGPPAGQARCADHLEGWAGRLEVVLAEWRQVDAEREVLQTSATLVQDLVLGDVNIPSSLAMSLSMVAEEVKGRINTAAANGVRWGTRSALFTPCHTFPN